MPIGAIGANNAAFNIMKDSNSMQSMTRAGGNPASMLTNEKKLNADMIKNNTAYLANSAMEDSMDKVKNDNIKRTFDTFA